MTYNGYKKPFFTSRMVNRHNFSCINKAKTSIKSTNSITLIDMNQPSTNSERQFISIKI